MSLSVPTSRREVNDRQVSKASAFDLSWGATGPLISLALPPTPILAEEIPSS